MLFCFGLFALLLYNTVVANAECSYTYVNDSQPIQAAAAEFQSRGYRCCVFLIQAPSQYRVTLNFTRIFGFRHVATPQGGHGTQPSPPSTGSTPLQGAASPPSSRGPSSLLTSTPSSLSPSGDPGATPPLAQTGGLREGSVHVHQELAKGGREEGETEDWRGEGDKRVTDGRSVRERENAAAGRLPARGQVEAADGHWGGKSRLGPQLGQAAGQAGEAEASRGLDSWLSEEALVKGNFPEVQVREVLAGREKLFAVISPSQKNPQSPKVMETHSQAVKVVYIWGPGHHSGFTLYFDFVRNTSLCDGSHATVPDNCSRSQPATSLELVKVAVVVGCVTGVMVVLVAVGLVVHARCRPNASLLHYHHAGHAHRPQSQSSETFASPVQEHLDQQVALLRDRHGSGPGSGGGGSQGEVEVGLPPQIPLSLDGEEGYSVSQRQLALAHATQRASQQDLFRPPPNRTVHDRVSPPPYSPPPPSPPPYSPYPHATWSGGSSLDLLGAPLPRCHSLSARHSTPLDQLSFLPPIYSPGGYPNGTPCSPSPAQGHSPPRKCSPPQRHHASRKYSPPYGPSPPGRGAPWHPHLQTLPPDTFPQDQDLSWGLPRSRHASEPGRMAASERVRVSAPALGREGAEGVAPPAVRVASGTRAPQEDCQGAGRESKESASLDSRVESELVSPSPDACTVACSDNSV